jgi:peptide/nickel transport system permease protein
VYFVAFRLGWFPIGGSRAPGAATGGLGGAFDVLKHVLPPAFAFTVVSLGGWVLLMRNSMLTVMKRRLRQVRRSPRR